MTITVTDLNGNRKLSGPISGSGTANYLVKWSATLAQQNSKIIDGITAGDLTIQKTGSTARAIVVPDADIEIQGTAEVISGNWTARNHGSYTAIATATATDPASPSPGHEFTTLVRNGTITIGGTAYSTAGAIVTRIYHSGAWGNYVYPHLDGAWTWTAAQTIDRGTGATAATFPSTAQTGLRMYGGAGPNEVSPSTYGASWAATALSIIGQPAEGTRAAPAATTSDRAFVNILAYGHNGSAYTTSPAGRYQIAADGTWSLTNNGLYHLWTGTPNGSTVVAEWMRLQNGNLGIGGTPTAGNGLIQLASGTTKANGIAFGTDTFLFRAASSQIFVTGASATDVLVNAQRSTGETAVLHAGNGVCVVGSASNHPVWIRSNGAQVLSIDSSSNVVMGTAALATSATDGFLYLETCAGAPTGVPTSFTGRVPMIYDTTNNKLWVYNGAWKGVVLA